MIGAISAPMTPALRYTLKLLLALAFCAFAAAAPAQTPPPKGAHSQKPAAPMTLREESPGAASSGSLKLSAALAANDVQGVKSGVVWRVFEDRAEPNGSHKLVAESSEAAPSIQLPNGIYVVHAAYGLAGVARRVAIDGRPVSERLLLNAGGLKLIDILGEAHIPPQRLSIAIYVPERGNAEAKLVLSNAKGGEIIALPEGVYHVVSTLLDTTQGAQGENNATNSVVTADLRVPAGKLIEATLRHRAATMTLKLVKAPGGEALANTSFSVLTPGGDVIRELIGAFPSLVLAEGEYVAIARHDGKTFQTTFKVQSTQDRDVEIVADQTSAPTP
jgi:hypothetical protein